MKRNLVLSEKTMLQIENMNMLRGGQECDDCEEDYTAAVASICDNSPKPKPKVSYPCK
ncbi:hypothetical protein [Paludibacter sp.]|uniref:hypothetical protein n=1 Tax=Paludibacter sp. TaxID=1898105 RepID=UPI0025DE515E|nr:hypothetical protein [Paludibacter sp.]